MAIDNPLSKLFTQVPTTQNVPPASVQNIQTNETYTEYGKRVCGIVTGNTTSLEVFLTKVCQTEKNRQINDQAEQQRIKQGLQNNLLTEERAEQATQAQLANTQLAIQEANDRLNDLSAALEDAKAKDGEENKMAKIKMSIGIIILVILTFYLFIFYSSTFYSAFLLTASQLISLGQNALNIAMFNTNAIPEAYHQGLGAMFFILSAPIIFMGLGYALHFFMEQRGNGKWIKSALLLIITLCFDCILAFKIGKLIYEIEVINSWTELPPYSIDIAINDINTWAVIFCGFIVYVIWGIVFDMTMTAYSDLRSNKNEINTIKKQISQARAELSKHQQEIAPLQAALANHKAKIEHLRQQIQRSFFINTDLMRVALADFFAGWMAIMPILIPGIDKHQEARNKYENMINTLNN